MNLDKHLPDGTVVEAPPFTRSVIHGIPVVFQITEWLLFIVAFQYVDLRFQSFPAKVVWMVLAICLSLYMGTLSSNAAWRCLANPFKNRSWSTVMYFIIPALTGCLVFWLLNVLVKDMVAAQIGQGA